MQVTLFYSTKQTLLSRTTFICTRGSRSRLKCFLCKEYPHCCVFFNIFHTCSKPQKALVDRNLSCQCIAGMGLYFHIHTMVPFAKSNQKHWSCVLSIWRFSHLSPFPHCSYCSPAGSVCVNLTSWRCSQMESSCNRLQVPQCMR